jgi:hypothetical protein
MRLPTPDDPPMVSTNGNPVSVGNHGGLAEGSFFTINQPRWERGIRAATIRGIPKQAEGKPHLFPVSGGEFYERRKYAARLQKQNKTPS